MFKTFKKLWTVVDISVDLIVDLAKAIQRELKEESAPAPSTEAPTNK